MSPNRFVTVLIALSMSCFGDTLSLRTGEKLSGSWLGADAGNIQFMVGGQVKDLERSTVSRVTFGSESALAVVPPPSLPEELATQEVYLRDASGAFRRLENSSALEGAQSTVRITGQMPVFAIKPETELQAGQLTLLPLDIGQGHRYTRPDPRLPGNTTALRLDITKTGASTFGFVPPTNLPSGEYAIVLRGVSGYFCFGID